MEQASFCFKLSFYTQNNKTIEAEISQIKVYRKKQIILASLAKINSNPLKIILYCLNSSSFLSFSSLRIYSDQHCLVSGFVAHTGPHLLCRCEFTHQQILVQIKQLDPDPLHKVSVRFQTDSGAVCFRFENKPVSIRNNLRMHAPFRAQQDTVATGIVGKICSSQPNQYPIAHSACCT